MVDSPHGLRPGADLTGWLSAQVEGTELGGDRLSLTSLSPLIDSANATPESWQRIIDDLLAHADPDIDGFVVVHGTDTMAHTCAALSYALTGLDRPVVVTGAQLPLGAIGSDAAPNVTGALRAVDAMRSQGLAGVALFFGHHLLVGNRATKSSSWAYQGFDSPSLAPLAVAGAPWRWSPGFPEGSGWDRPAPYARHDVVVIEVVPGITAARLEAMLTPVPRAVILRAYGAGNVPSDEPGLTRVLADMIEAGCAVVVGSQCHGSQVALGHYETAEAIARAGAVGTGDMTAEAAYAKVQFLLSQGLDGRGLADWMGRSIAGEVSAPRP